MEQVKIDMQNEQQKLAFDLIANTNSSFYLTGSAGTGKTTFLRNVQEVVGKQFITLAPTGVAAILAGGDTIHSFFGLPMEVCLPGTCGKMNDARICALRNADVIIIDEVSMVRCDIVDAIDFTMRHFLKSSQPFGGKQIVFVGDLFQLPPVVASGVEKELLADTYKTQNFFFYKANVIKRMRLAKIEFKKVYRQDTDKQFLQILENVRMNKITPENIMHLNTRVCEPSKEDGMVITLTTVNSTADNINQRKLDKIDSQEYVYEGSIEGKFDAKRLPVDMELHLKVGAQVMLTRNDTQRRWANGTLAKVAKLTDHEISIQLENGDIHILECCSWDSYNYEYDKQSKKLKKSVIGTFTQYPIKLAWAITIHKSQGTTFDKVALDLSRGIFASGQLYVALSRVRSMSGLYLSRKIIPQYANTNSEVLKFAQGYNDDKLIRNEIECGTAVYEFIKNNDYDNAARQYLLLIQKRVAAGDIREALFLSKQFLDILVCDEDLYGCIDEIPDNLDNQEHWTFKFLNALLNLYAGNYNEALLYINEVLEKHECQETLYLKSRALERMGRYNDADEVNMIIADKFNMSTPDVKVLYMISMLNELHVGDPGLDLMKRLVLAIPKYDRGIVSLRMLMKRNNLVLESSDNSELFVAFNSDISDAEFYSFLQQCRSEAPVAVAKMIDSIKKLVLE